MQRNRDDKIEKDRVGDVSPLVAIVAAKLQLHPHGPPKPNPESLEKVHDRVSAASKDHPLDGDPPPASSQQMQAEPGSSHQEEESPSLRSSSAKEKTGASCEPPQKNAACSRPIITLSFLQSLSFIKGEKVSAAQNHYWSASVNRRQVCYDPLAFALERARQDPDWSTEDLNDKLACFVGDIAHMEACGNDYLQDNDLMDEDEIIEELRADQGQAAGKEPPTVVLPPAAWTPEYKTSSDFDSGAGGSEDILLPTHNKRHTRTRELNRRRSGSLQKSRAQNEMNLRTLSTLPEGDESAEHNTPPDKYVSPKLATGAEELPPSHSDEGVRYNYDLEAMMRLSSSGTNSSSTNSRGGASVRDSAEQYQWRQEQRPRPNHAQTLGGPHYREDENDNTAIALEIEERLMQRSGGGGEKYLPRAAGACENASACWDDEYNF
eukprot:g1935.t1